MDSELIYLDHAAATPMDQRVLTAMMPYFSEQFFNPSSPYIPAIEVRRTYEDAKQRLAHTFGAKGDELVITAGATESINLAFNAVQGHVIVPAIEHHAVLAAARKKDHTIIPVDEHGTVRLDVLEAAITPQTVLVSVALANNELGTIQPLRAIAALLKREREARLSRGDVTPIYLHSDASQGVGQLDVHVPRLGVDMLTMNAGKMYGPKQIGLLWTASHVRLEPQIVGGGQERGLRSGTENVAGVVGFAKVAELLVEHRVQEAKRLLVLRDDLQQYLTEAFPQAVVSGNLKHRLAGHLHISFPGLDAERLIFLLESRGVLVATGSACAANKGTRSHVLTAIGLDATTADGSLRITLGHLSTDSTHERTKTILHEEITREYERVVR